jgi:uncharacterized protein
MLTEDEYRELSQVEDGTLPAEQSTVITKYQEYGMFTPNVVEEIEHYGSVLIEQYIYTRMKQLTLQVTQQCNLRCAYCAYSGQYLNQRTHSSKRMSLETAIQAIDFFLDHNSELSEVTIGFYGGEPLLEFDLMKQCTEYAKSKVEGKKVNFNITTNGTLISDEVADFFAENDFILNISLDGSKEEHDINRKFANGEGSFDTIIANIKKMRDRYPEYARKISIATTINPHIDLSCVMEYFSTDEVFRDRSIMFNAVNEKDYLGDLTYDQKYYNVRNYEYIKMLFSLAGKLDEKYVSPLVSRAKGTFDQKQKGIVSRTILTPKAHHGGPCLPGVKRLFVRTDGALFPCERINELLEFFKIGTLEDGLDIEKIRNILNIGKLTENECKNCWSLRQCTLCSAQIEFVESLTKKEKVRACPGSMASSFSDLHELCVLNEFGFNAEGATVL